MDSANNPYAAPATDQDEAIGDRKVSVILPYSISNVALIQAFVVAIAGSSFSVGFLGNRFYFFRQYSRQLLFFSLAG